MAVIDDFAMLVAPAGRRPPPPPSWDEDTQPSSPGEIEWKTGKSH
jgi:hypothetical protein